MFRNAPCPSQCRGDAERHHSLEKMLKVTIYGKFPVDQPSDAISPYACDDLKVACDDLKQFGHYLIHFSAALPAMHIVNIFQWLDDIMADDEAE